MISLYHLFVKGDVGRGCIAGGVQLGGMQLGGVQLGGMQLGGVQLGGVQLGGVRRIEDRLRVFRRIVRLVFQQISSNLPVLRLLSPENKEEPTIPKGVVGSMGL